MKRIEVTVSPKGETQVETYGYEGDSCRAATKSLERARGIRAGECLKPEFYQSTESKVQQKEGQ